MASNGFPPQAVWICIEYFAYESKAAASRAKQLARTFGAIGVLATLKQLTAAPNQAIPDFATSSSPIDAQIQRALALAGSPGVLAIETFKMLNGLTTPATPANPQAPHYPPSPQAAKKLKRYECEDGIEILINPATGESFCSIRGYARMAGKDKSTIHSRVTAVGEIAAKTAKVPTATGLQGVVLITEDQITEWLPQDNPAAATLLLKMGVRMALHKMAGYEVKSTAMPETQPIVSPLDAQIQRAISLAGGGGALAIEAFKLIHGIHDATPASPEPKPIKHTKAIPTPPPVQSKADQEAEARELVQGFMRDIQTLVNVGILGPWDVSNITQKFKPCTAIVLKSAIPLLEAHFSYQIDRVRLESAIVNLGGKGSQNQRFEPESSAKRNGQRSIVRKCIVIPASMI